MLLHVFTLFFIHSTLFIYSAANCSDNAVHTANSIIEILKNEEFSLWYRAMLCKEIKREEVAVSSRSFLEIDDSTYPNSVFFVPGNACYIKSEYINKTGDARCVQSTSDISKKEYRLYDAKEHCRYRSILLGTKEDDNVGKSLHIISHPKHGSDLRLGNEYSLYGNSLIINTRKVVSAATCAEKSGKLWISCETHFPENYFLTHNEASECSVRLLWIETFKNPLKIGEIKIPVGSWSIAKGSVAVKFLEDGSAFQVYYDPSGLHMECKEESLPAHLKQAEDMIEKSLPPGQKLSPVKYSKISYKKIDKKPIVITYTLQRIDGSLRNISHATLINWHKSFLNFKQGLLTEDELSTVRESMSSIIDNENDV